MCCGMGSGAGNISFCEKWEACRPACLDESVEGELGQLEDLVRLGTHIFHIVCNQHHPGTERLDYPSLSNTGANYFCARKLLEFLLLFNSMVQVKTWRLDKKRVRWKWKGKEQGYFQAGSWISSSSVVLQNCVPRREAALSKSGRIWCGMEGLTSSCQSTPTKTPAEPIKSLKRLFLLACPNSMSPEQLRVEKGQRSSGGGNLGSVKTGLRTAAEVLNPTKDPGEFLGANEWKKKERGHHHAWQHMDTWSEGAG